MNVITRRRIMEFSAGHADAAGPLDLWYRTVRQARWQSIQEVRRVFPHADAVEVASGNTVTVFNVSGNRYRLITAIHYNHQRVYVLLVMTHAEYDKGTWKKSL